MAQIALALVNKNDTPKTSILVDSSGNEITTGNPLVTTANLATGSAVEILDSAGVNKLSVDTLGRLTLVPNQVVELGDGTTPTQKLAIDASGRLTLVPTQTVEILDSAGVNKLAIDTSGRLTLVPNQVVELGDGTTPTQKLAIDASGRLTLVPTQTVEILDSAGTNKLAIDASGRLTVVNLAQLAGTVPLLETIGAPLTGAFTFQSLIRRATIAGNVYSFSTGKVTGVAGTQALQLFNPASGTKNLLITRLTLTNGAGVTFEVRKITADQSGLAGWTNQAITPINNGASATATTMTLGYSTTNVTGAATGTIFQDISLAVNSTSDVFINDECLWCPSGAAGIVGISIFFTSTAVTWTMSGSYIEF